MIASPAQAQPTQRASGPLLAPLYQLFFTTFCSLRLTVGILLVLLSGSVVGMFVDQTLTYEEHARAWSQSPIQLYVFTFLELHDVFHSWWFSTFILLLGLNLIACSIERLPRIWLDIRHPERTLSDRTARTLKHRATFHVPAREVPAFKEAFLSAVGRARPARETGTEGECTHVYTEKHPYARTGVYVVHVALLLIMGGSISTTTFGFDGNMGIVEGSSNRFAFGKGPAGLRYRKDLGFTVTCTDFRLKQFSDGAPMDYESDLVVHQDGREVVRKTIQVNDPLEYGGFTFYQASFQPVEGDEKVRLSIGKPGQPKSEHVVTPGTTLTIPGSDVSFVPLEVIPQYASLGPALRMQQVQPGKPPTSFVVFQEHPDFDEQVRRGEFALQYKGADKTYMTGLQVASFPGVSVVFTGFALMFIGMYMAFFMSHRRYWLRLRPDGQRVEAVVAGSARRHADAFEDEFAALLGALDKVAGSKRVDGQTDDVAKAAG